VRGGAGDEVGVRGGGKVRGRDWEGRGEEAGNE
jgi:hypothetical protein